MRQPLAHRLRPKSLEELVGQEHVLGQGKPLRQALDAGVLPSMIVWGPPGSGKTSFIKLITGSTACEPIYLTAVSTNTKEINGILKAARDPLLSGKKPVLIIDELQHLNRSQQEVLLPYVEDGSIVFIGISTDNPSFALNRALLSRTTLVVFEPLKEQAMKTIIGRALSGEGQGDGIRMDDDAMDYIIVRSSGDARKALNAVELLSDIAFKRADRTITLRDASKLSEVNLLPYDRKEDEHYHTISAFIKSMRGSDPDAALYYLARMIESGEDPRFVLRRMIIFSSEDIGNADPLALTIAVAAFQAFEIVGMPEGFIPIAHAVAYLASSPKSNASYLAYLKAKEDIRKSGYLDIPRHIVNPVTEPGRELGYGEGYKYPHDYEGGHVEQQYLPDRLKDRRYYVPKNIGYERVIKEYLERIKKGAGDRGTPGPLANEGK
ncbi:MAG: replication-associated recombination protein A [Deltaproteobacteria bacterium]|nr:replication-associated recombination protein A [Deltaproteobacteria bacterium]MCL5277977.1 replication-associated recombination protein A [Deltaproteobacteria bacterium]